MAKTPRFVPYSKLIYRLYEALYMLDILKHNILGPHHVANLDFSTLLAVRRRFLGNIAFFCDYTKGGRTSTAVAIEDGRICNTFWVSSNEGPQEEVRTFVESVITKAKAFHAIPDDQKAEAEIDLTGQCINFALSRIRKQAHGLSNSAQSCRKFITATMTDQQDLGQWLRQFEFSSYKDLTKICHCAYEARKDSEMNLLLKLSGGLGTSEATWPTDIALVFRKVRHIIGRLAAYIRAVKEFIEDVSQMGNLLDEFEVALVPQPASVRRLPADNHTDLSGVLKRMLRTEDTRLPQLLEYLSDLDEQTRLEQDLRDRFDPGKPPPNVHAEVQMLHHFYDNGRKFFAYDNYIATSKPACFCCKLYFRYHPANYVEPDSHEKIYVNWGPILLTDGQKDRSHPIFIEQRKILSSIITDLGKEVTNEIERRRTFSLHYEHQDTLTGLTASTYTLGGDSSDSLDEVSDGSVESDSETDSGSDGGAGI